MKPLKYISVISSMILLSACTEELAKSDAEGDEIRVTAGFADTKTTFVDDGNSVNVYWAEGDRIGIFSEAQDEVCYIADSDGRTTVFSALEEKLTAANGTAAYAYYPYVAYAEKQLDHAAELVPTQTIRYPNNAGKYDFVYASATVQDGKLDFKFKHYFSFIKLNIPVSLLGTGQYLRFDSTENISTIGEYIDLRTGEMLNEGDKFHQIHCIIDPEARNNETLSIYFPILPQPEGTEIKLYTSTEENGSTYINNCILTKTVPAGGFKAGRMYSLNLTDEEEENPEKEIRDVLIALYNSTNGANWTNNDNWLSDRPISEWYGINYSANQFSIDLSNNNLTGTLPEEIGNLKGLKSLYLNNNMIEGKIPAGLWNLTDLEQLVVYSMMRYDNATANTLPAEIGNLVNLIRLDLDGNSLSGSIPKEIGNLTKLQTLYLNGNNFSGSIPEEIGNLVNARYMYLGSYNLTGEIPESLGNCENLTTLSICSSQISGAIPESICNLPLLSYLYLNHNRLSGEIPSYLSKLMGNCQVQIMGNLFTGKVPAAIQQHGRWELQWPTFLYLNNGLDLTDAYLPGPAFTAPDLSGSTVIAENEYTGHKYTIILQWYLRSNNSYDYFDAISEKYDEWKGKGVEVISWCSHTAPNDLETFNQFITERNVRWKQLEYSYIIYPYNLYSGFAVVVDQNKEIVFETITNDPYELFDFMDDRLASDEPIFTISSQSVTVPESGGTFDITVNTNVNFWIDKNRDWVKQMSSSGNADPASSHTHSLLKPTPPELSANARLISTAT